jgi:hypothetical protein
MEEIERKYVGITLKVQRQNLWIVQTYLRVFSVIFVGSHTALSY